MVLVIVAVAGLMLFMRTQPAQAQQAAQEQQKAATPTASPTTGQQGVTGNGDFASVMNLITAALATTNNIIQTNTQKN